MKEIKFIENIRARAAAEKDVIAGIGDDAAVLKHDSKQHLLWAADMLVEDVHFSLKDASFNKIGRKAVAVNISDIAAMGGVPKYITVSIGVPPYVKIRNLNNIYDGIFKICKAYGICLVGGDTNRSGKLVIDVSIIGSVEKKRLVLRSAAKEGDIILVTGPIPDGRKTHFDFTPRLKEARFLTGKYKISSMIDISDGIAPDIGRICCQSGVGCVISEEAVPLSEGLSIKDAFYYGENFELLFTMSPKEARRLFLDLSKKNSFKKVFFVIGEITNKNKGMYSRGKEGVLKKLKMEGYRHI
ncbi:MAG: thiamine-monophosphate kinase [Candidatus Omnitrophica bacterium]|nr:thiamine-monophosphate kinase [Candidatus Omnitrophota bacterium]